MQSLELQVKAQVSVSQRYQVLAFYAVVQEHLTRIATVDEAKPSTDVFNTPVQWILTHLGQLLDDKRLTSL
jgi:hypothetical protein